MKAKALLPLLLCAGAAGCEQESQLLPVDATSTVATRTISPAGGAVTLPGGAALHFPAGALAGPADVTLRVDDSTAPAGSGQAASTWYGATPSNLTLAEPAVAEVKFDTGTDRERAWLATVVQVTPAGVRELADTRVDLTTGIARAASREMGTFGVVLPTAAAVFPVAPLGAAGGSASISAAPIARRIGTDSVAIECGAAPVRCEGITVRASANLLDRVQRAAVVYPAVRGGLKLDPRTSRVRGRISVDATVRALLRSGASTASIAVDVEDFVVDQQVALPSPLGSLAGLGGAASQAAAGELVITVVDTVDIVNATGGTEPATVAISFPVTIF